VSWPRGLRLASVTGTWWRVDRDPPAGWDWAPFPQPRQRFDSAAGAFRTRYAARSARGALREAFDGSGRVLADADLDRRLVRLHGTARVLDLRRESVLDAFGVDDRISTARDPGTWRRCHELIDRVAQHYGERCDGLLYRSRTTPQTSANLAFLAHAPLRRRDLGPLRDQRALLDAAIIGDGFAVLT